MNMLSGYGRNITIYVLLILVYIPHFTTLLVIVPSLHYKWTPVGHSPILWGDLFLDEGHMITPVNPMSVITWPYFFSHTRTFFQRNTVMMKKALSP